MIIILTEKLEVSSTRVEDWIKYYGNNCIIIEDIYPIKILDLNISNTKPPSFTIKYKHEIIHSDKISAFWWRRGFFHDKIELEFQWINVFDSNAKNNVINFFNREEVQLYKFIYFVLSSTKRSIGNILNYPINKLILLESARKLGLNIPETYIINNKQKLKSIYKEHKNIITKSICDNLSFEHNGQIFYHQTEKIISNDFDILSSDFYYSKVQQLIDKKYELRIFFFKNKFYSMAIFSQLNEETKIDYRAYNNSDIKYFIPYKLPIEIKNKLKKLMKLVKLDTGSIDMILTTKNEYVFLEVNPIGVFDMVTTPCNYYCEKYIAQYLLGSRIA